MNSIEAMKAANAILVKLRKVFGDDLPRSVPNYFELGHETNAAISQLRAAIKAAQPSQQHQDKPSTLPTIGHALGLAQPSAISDERIDDVMTQAQVFASSWAIVGSRFDNGDGYKDAEEAKDDLRTMIIALLSERPGWVSVLREPTPEMWDAAWNSIGLSYRAKLSMHEIKTLFDKFHSAMLAAAQTERVIYPKRDRLPDDERKALDAMVSAMSEKLYRKYIEGYSGFEGASEEHLNRLLHEHLTKGDPVDVANFCAFLLHNGQRVRLSPERVSVQVSDDRKLWLWKNFVDGRPEYWAFDNPYPIHLHSDDPQTLGEPIGYAIFKESRTGRTDVSESDVISRIKKAAAPKEAR